MRISGYLFVHGGLTETLAEMGIEGLNKRAILVGSGVPGKGLATAPGLEGYFNPKSKAADKAGKKK